MILSRCADCRRSILVSWDVTSGRFRRLEIRPAIRPAEAVYRRVESTQGPALHAVHPDDVDVFREFGREARLHLCTLPPGSER